MDAKDYVLRFACRPARDGDYLIQLGADGAPFVAHGSGWNIYLGPAPTPVPASAAPNPIGAAMAAIVAAAAALRSNLAGLSDTVLLNALDWQHAFVEPGRAELAAKPDCGAIWTAGTGSIGTAILYFLAMETRRGLATLFDMDIVQVHNLDRAPVFVAGHVGLAKVQATSLWLHAAGVAGVRCECARARRIRPLARPRGRNAGYSHRRRERAERAGCDRDGLPADQIHGTTGKNWQAAVIRHIPLKTRALPACSRKRSTLRRSARPATSWRAKTVKRSTRRCRFSRSRPARWPPRRS
jgi:hypothetical protein